MATNSLPEVLFFDVFGTTVDWRSSVLAQLEEFGAERGLQVDWSSLVVEWRSEWNPLMQQIVAGKRAWMPMEALNLEALTTLLPKYRLEKLSSEDRQAMLATWKRIQAWPDVVPALTKLKKSFTLCALSNGGVGGLVSVARHAGLPWDAVLGSNIFHTYKPDHKLYQGAMELLNRSPEQVLMVAAHNFDLKAARECGMRTAYIVRPTQYGPQQTTEKGPEENWEITASNFLELADRLETR